MIKELLNEKGINKIEIDNPSFKGCRFYKIREFSYDKVKYDLVLVIMPSKIKIVTLFKGNTCINNIKINPFERMFFMDEMNKFLQSSDFQDLIPLLSDTVKNEIKKMEIDEMINLILTNGDKD